ncbi:MAG TPA: DedA family protein [Burkholderiales bacterium]|nr:DedA family protein [Burkholderiales bacterium]
MSADTLQHVIDAHGTFLHHYGYLAVFLLVMLEDFGLPTPGETTLIAASLIAARGGLHIEWVIACAWLGAMIGDNIGFAIGRYGGMRLLVRYGSYVGINAERLSFVQRFFDRWGGAMVMLARFVELARQINGIVAGSAGMTRRHFLLYNTLGAALWVGVWSLGTFFFGDRILAYLPNIARASFLLLVVALALLIALGWRLSRRRPS